MLGINDPFAAHGNVGDFDAAFFERLSGVEHGMVLDGRGDDVLVLASCDAADHAEEREIVGFGAAAGENDFAGLRPSKRGHRARAFPRRRGRAGRRNESSWRCRIRWKYGSMASRTAGSTGVVALWSR